MHEKINKQINTKSVLKKSANILPEYGNEWSAKVQVIQLCNFLTNNNLSSDTCWISIMTIIGYTNHLRAANFHNLGHQVISFSVCCFVHICTYMLITHLVWIYYIVKPSGICKPKSTNIEGLFFTSFKPQLSQICYFIHRRHSSNLLVFFEILNLYLLCLYTSHIFNVWKN